MPYETLIKEAAGTSDEILEEVLHYLQYLKRAEGAARPESAKEKRKKAYGMYRGAIWMSEDFDEPLGDFKEYM